MRFSIHWANDMSTYFAANMDVITRLFHIIHKMNDSLLIIIVQIFVLVLNFEIKQFFDINLTS